MHSKAWSVFILAIILSGPAATLARQKDERPEMYVVSILSGGHLKVVGVDGASKTFLFKKRLRVSPGQHQLQLQTSHLASRDKNDKKTYQGKVELGFDAKNGHTYTFAMHPDSWSISEETQVCIYEEPTDDPKAAGSMLGEFRRPGPNAQKIACAPLKAEVLY